MFLDLDQPQGGGDALPVEKGVAEQQRVRRRALEVQVRRMLPGEPHAAVDLDHAADSTLIGGRAERLRGTRRHGRVRFASGLCYLCHLCRRGRVGDRVSGLRVDEHVGAPVLDGLEASDLAAELLACLGVLDRHVEHAVDAPDGLDRQRRGGGVTDEFEDRQGLPSTAEQARGDARQLKPGQPARLIHRLQRQPDQPRGVAIDNELRHPGRSPREGDHDISGGTVDDVVRGAVNPPASAVTGSGKPHRYRAGQPARGDG